MIAFDSRQFIIIISLAVQISLLIILYRRAYQSIIGRAYAVSILAIIGWVMALILFRSNLYGQLLLWVRALYLMAIFTSASFLYFSLTFSQERRPPHWTERWIALESVIMLILTLHPTWVVRGAIAITGEEHLIFLGPLFALYAAHVSGLFALGFLVLVRKLRITAPGEKRQQIATILGGYLAAATLAMITNLFLPWFGNSHFNWVGPIVSTLVAIFSTIAILRFKFLGIKMLATELIVLIINFLIFIQVLRADSWHEFFIRISLLFAVLFLTWLLSGMQVRELRHREERAHLQALEESNRKLKELDRQKSEFLTIAAHQLRTPASIINNYVSVLQDGDYGKLSEEVQQILLNIDQSNQWLVRLADDFLNISKLEQDEVKFDLAQVDLIEIVNNVVNELPSKIEAGGLKLVWNRPSEPAIILADEEKIRACVVNMLDNAIKYGKIEDGVSPPTITVVISITNKNNGVSFSVSDHGIGFEKEDEQRFFQKFSRGNNAKGLHVNLSTGLGLFICKKFIEGHEGEVWAKSDGVGKGSEFGFWVPIKQG